MSRKKLRKALKDPNTVHQVRLSDGRVVERFLCDELAAHLAGRPREALVFTAPMGGPLRERKFLHGQLLGRRAAGRPARNPARPRPPAHGREPAYPPERQRQGGAEDPRPPLRGGDPGPLRDLWPDELEDLAERLDRARAAAVAPSTRPTAPAKVVPIRKRPGQ